MTTITEQPQDEVPARKPRDPEAIATAAAQLTKRLPWAVYDDDCPDDRLLQIRVDGAAAYAAWHAALQEKYKSPWAVAPVPGAEPVTYPVALDQYWLQVMHECIKLDVQFAIAGTALDPRMSGEVLQLRFGRAEGFELAGKSTGRGTTAASKGKEGRLHFGRIRGAGALALAVA